MNLNQAMYYVTQKYPKSALFRLSNILLQPRSSLSSFKKSSTSILKFQEESLSTHYRYLKRRNLLCFCSSAVNEEHVKIKNPVISVPPLKFEALNFDLPVTHSDLCNALQICDSVEEQMICLASTMSLTPEDVENRIYFMKKIESLLKPFFGDINIQLFGSTLNGFGFKGCDLDMSFETLTGDKEKIDFLENPDVPLVSEVLCGKVSPTEIALLPRKEQLLFIHNVLLEFYQESEDPPIFINAIIPLIRFHHDKYGLKCDLTCGNRVAFSNTKLLYLYGKLDERVKPLMMTIRYWAKHVELIGKGLMFNTYTISLLVIHFLQTRSPPILPSAEYLLSLSDSLRIEDMNDTSFLQIRNHIPPSENKQTLSELLKDFFLYYLYFDFTRVICPLIGGSVPRDEFFSDPVNKKFRMNSICVQDPMLLSHNVAELVDYKHCKKLFTELMIGCRLFQNTEFLHPSPDKWGILALFDKPNHFFNNYVNLMKNVTFQVPLVTKQIIKNNVKESQKLYTAETLLFILQHVLLFECKTLRMCDLVKQLERHDKEIDKLKRLVQMKNEQVSNLVNFLHEKYKRKPKNEYLQNSERFDDALMLEDFQAFNSKNKLLLCAECKVSKNIWLGRDNVSLETLPEEALNNVIEKEHFISLHSARQTELNIIDKKEKIKPFVFFFECYESPDLPESSLLLNFRTFQKTSFNPIIGIFLIDYLPKLIEKANKSL